MSMAALRWVRPIRCTPTQKAVLWALADQANDAGEAWPSISSLVEATCLSERAVQNALADLRRSGLIEATSGGGRHRTSLYRLALDTPHGMRGSGGGETPQQVRETPQQVRETPQQVHPNPQEPSRTPIEPSRRARSAAVVVALPGWLSPEAWGAWCQHRLAKGRKGWTPAAAVRCIAVLERLRAEGDDPAAVIDQSIASGWTGLFALKQRPSRGRASNMDWLVADMLANTHPEGSA